MEQVTPMMKQYIDIKKEYKDCILMFRLGDFYEMFFDDALVAARELEIALTKRATGNNNSSPMCGVPYHVADTYISKLVAKGYKVAVCEQLENPNEAKGIVKRGIVKIVTPGTTTNADNLKSDKNNYLMSLFWDKFGLSISYADISTGDIYVTQIENQNNLFDLIIDEIEKIQPSEILFSNNLKDSTDFLNKVKIKNNILFTFVENPKSIEEAKNRIEELFDDKIDNISTYLNNKKYSILNISILLNYIFRFQKEKLPHLKKISQYEIKKYMNIDANSRINLELTKNLFTNSKKGSLLSILDNTVTPMGARLLKNWLEIPLMEKDKIYQRQDMIEFFLKNINVLHKLKDCLKEIYDIERICGKISLANINCKDLIFLKNSISNIPEIKRYLSKINEKHLKLLGEKIDSLEDIHLLISNSIVDDPPILITEGGIIKSGYSKELDDLKKNSNLGKKQLIDFEIDERERLNIKNLKIIYNKKLGYFIDITKSNIKNVPKEYILKQTLTNSNRYTTDKLDKIQNLIFNSENEIINLEYELFQKIRLILIKNIKRMQNTGNLIALLDVILSLSDVAYKNNYIRPVFNDKNIIMIKESRHPVVENTMDKNEYIANDVNLGHNGKIIQIITGPNMSGKSTYMRQAALSLIMAQMGSFIPAKKADISIVDKIFTRIGASDNLFKGESTFMVEMKEMSKIINHATENSLLILDEVGRGTSTYDGLSIAWAIIEYISKKLKSKTLFATHYHELTELEEKFDNIENLKIDVEECNNEIIFLHKILKGKANKSYGIEVAKLAGFPNSIINKAQKILFNINSSNHEKTISSKNNIKEKETSQLSFSQYQKDLLFNRLLNINLDEMTPFEAMKLLNEIINQAKSINERYKNE